MNTIDQETLLQIRSSIDIVDIIGNYIPLIQRGKNYFGVCPFHDDSNPSMSVSKEKQIYTCFSCGATGNVFKFIMDYENISFREVVKKCAEIAGIDIKLDIAVKKDSSEKHQILFDIYETSMKFYQNNINTNIAKEAKEYLNARQIDDEVIKEFGIGLALKDRDFLSKLLVNKKFSEKDLLRSGLILKNDYGLIDIYYNRIMFPIENILGKVVGFSGRNYDGTDNAKYINTRETEIFKKGEILYNYTRAKNEARSSGFVIVMEGFMDVIRAYTIGVRNVVATMGTAVTKNQATAIKKMAKEVYLCFDGDDAGRKATLACTDELLKIGVTPKIIRLEDGLDPDDFIRKNGKEEFLSKINNPINVMDFKLSYLKHNKNINNTEDLASYVNEVINELSKIDDEVLREITLKKISLEADLEIDFLKSRLDNAEVKVNNVDIKHVENKKSSKYEKAESYLIYYMLRYKDVIKLYNKKITYMPTLKYRYLARDIALYYKEYSDINVADFITYLGDNNDMIKVVGEILSLNLKEDYVITEIEDYIRVIRDYNVNNYIKKLQMKMQTISNPLEQAKIADEIMKIKLENND